MIDWSFLDKLEDRRLVGYVPDPEESLSGVTVATGVDLAVGPPPGLPAALAARLAPYAGYRRGAAVARLRELPLILSAPEADLIDEAARAALLRRLSARFLADSGEFLDLQGVRFETVVASVTFQYGDPWNRCPIFWRAACRKDVPAMIAELEDFGDRYPTRRKAEAAYLASAEGSPDRPSSPAATATGSRKGQQRT